MKKSKSIIIILTFVYLIIVSAIVLMFVYNTKKTYKSSIEKFIDVVIQTERKDIENNVEDLIEEIEIEKSRIEKGYYEKIGLIIEKVKDNYMNISSLEDLDKIINEIDPNNIITYTLYDESSNNIIQSGEELYLYYEYENIEKIDKILERYLYTDSITNVNNYTIFIGIVRLNIDNYVKSELNRVLNHSRKNNIKFQVSEILDYNGGDKFAKVLASNTKNKNNEIVSTNETDAVGRTFYKNMLENIRQSGESTDTFYLEYKDIGKIEPVISYCKLYERYDLIVGAGVYKEDIDILTKNSISDFGNILNAQIMWIVSTTILLIVAITVLLAVLFNSIKKKQVRLLKMENKIIENHYKIIEKKYDETNKIIHDFKNLIIVIKGFISKGNIVELEDYIEKVYSTTSSLQRTILTNNKVIDIILNEKVWAMDENNIVFRHNIEYVDLSYINNVDMSIIIGNLLDNAIESCNRSERKLISLNIYKFNKSINVIKINNSCEHEPKIIENKFITSKINKDYHGYGIKNVKDILKKYNGNITFKHHKELKEFEVILMIPKCRI